MALTEPDGVTTKINEPGPVLSEEQQEALIGLLLERARGASWVVLAGSLPPGVPGRFLRHRHPAAPVARGRHGGPPLIAVDSSGAPLAAAASGRRRLPGNRTSSSPTPRNWRNWLPQPASPRRQPPTNWKRIRRQPQQPPPPSSSGVGAVLATLGSKGAVLVTADGAWLATHPPVTAVSTVGAGDSSLAGYLLAHGQGAAPADCLRQAVAHGAAAASLPGSTVPAVHQTTPDAVTITALRKD